MKLAHMLTLATLAGGLMAAGEAAAKPISTLERARIVAAIMSIETQWNQDIAARDAARFASYYRDDATLIQPFTSPVYRRSGILAAITQAFADPNFSLTFRPDVVAVSPDGLMAYTQGRCTESETDPTTHDKVVNSCTYLTIYEKGADGAWKVSEDIATPAPAPKS